MCRVGNNISPRGSAQNTNDIILSFMPNESPLKMGHMNTAGNS